MPPWGLFRLPLSALCRTTALFTFLIAGSSQVVKDNAFTAKPVDLGLQGGSPKTEIQWSPCSDHLFVVDKSGILTVKSPSGLPGFTYDFTAATYKYGDHGPLGLQIHPQFPTQPYLFIFYTSEGVPSWNDDCPASRLIGGRQLCKVTSKLIRLRLAVTAANGVCSSIKFTSTAANPYLLKEDWCSSSLTHGNGDLKFYGSTGDLLLTAGDGSQAGGVDVGIAADECYNAAKKMPQGKMRAQRMDFINGKLLRISAADIMKTTGQLTFPGEMQVVGRGLRQAYSMVVDKNLNLFVGDVGSKLKEEINFLSKAQMADKASYPYNFGWPCIQGTKYITEVQEKDWMQKTCNPATAYDCNICADIYPCDKNAPGQGGCSSKYVKPAFEFRGITLDSDYPDECKQKTSAITGLAFLDGSLPQFGTLGKTRFPYNLIAADYGTGCVFTFSNKADGTPNFAGGAQLLLTGHKVHVLQQGRDGYIYSARTDLGTINTFWKHGVPTANDGPSATLTLQKLVNGVWTACSAGGNTCNVASGAKVRADASGSTIGGSAITGYKFAWGDGKVEQGTVKVLDHAFADGSYTITLTVTDAQGQTDVVTAAVLVGQAYSITMVPASYQWKQGDVITLTLNAPTTPTAVEWDATISHCGANKCTGQDDCHIHTNGIDPGATVKGGKLTPPGHELPSSMEISALVTLANGQTVTVTQETHCMEYNGNIQTTAGGVAVAGWTVENGEVGRCTTPCVRPFMANNVVTLTAGRVQAKTAKIYKFFSWKKTLKSTGVTTGAGTTPAAAQNDIRIQENNMVLLANYERVFPTASAATPPSLVGTKGFYTSLEVIFQVPAGVLYDYVVVSVVSATSSDFSVVVPASGFIFATVDLPATAATYTVKLAGYAYTANTLTAWSQGRAVTTVADASQLCYEEPAAYNDAPIALPGTLEAERFMAGGQGIGYFDTTPGNQGNAGFRSGVAVDINAGGSGGFAVTQAVNGEWLAFLVNVGATKNYTVTYTLSSADANQKQLYIMVDSAVCQQTLGIAKANFGASAALAAVTVANVPLTKGSHILRLCIGGLGSLNIDKIGFA